MIRPKLGLKGEFHLHICQLINTEPLCDYALHRVNNYPGDNGVTTVENLNENKIRKKNPCVSQ